MTKRDEDYENEKTDLTKETITRILRQLGHKYAVPLARENGYAIRYNIETDEFIIVDRD